MDYSHEQLHGAKYIPLEIAQKESGLPLPDLKRAITLGVIATAEIGNTLFLERTSLNRFLSGGEDVEEERADVFLDSLTSRLRKQEVIFMDEDHENDPKEQAVFREALMRDKTASSLISPMPLVSTLALAFVALILSLPTPRMYDVNPTGLAAISQKDVKEATHDEIYAFFNYTTEETSGAVARGFNTPHAPLDTNILETQNIRDQQASAIGAWFSATRDALAKLALHVYHTTNTLLGIE